MWQDLSWLVALAGHVLVNAVRGEALSIPREVVRACECSARSMALVESVVRLVLEVSWMEAETLMASQSVS